MRCSGRLRGRPAAPGRRGTGWHRVPPQAVCSRGAGPPSRRPRADAPSRRRRGVPCSSILPGYVRSPRLADGRSPFYVSMAWLATCACGVLVGAGDGAVHAHHPLQLAHRIGSGLHVGQQAISGAVAPPTYETVVAGLPRAVARWQVTPGRAGPKLPEDAVYDLAIVFPLLAPSPIFGQKRLDLLPCLIRQLASSDQCCANISSSIAPSCEEASRESPCHWSNTP